MSLFGTRTHRPALRVDPNAERRPSHWNEEVNEFEQLPEQDYPTLESTKEPVYSEPPSPVATPVYLTETPPSDRTIRQRSAGNLVVDTTADKLCGSDRRRKRMLVTNAGDTNSLYVGSRSEDLPFMCYLVEPNQSIELFDNDQVWAFAAASSTTVTWLIEYELDE